MINIVCDPGKAMTISGHAEYAPKGLDIVCAAVSALYYTLTALPGIACSDNGDEREIWVTEDSEEVRIWFNTISETLQRIADRHPDNVRYKVDCLYFTN